MGILEKIAEIEKEMSRTQKNKATEYHIGLLKAKLARYRTMLLEPTSKSGPKGEGFDVMKSGDARVAMIGFPSVGKSTFLSKSTETRSESANYEFTTLTCIPGKIHYKGADIQLLDLPGIIEGAAQGKGRGRQVISVAKTADLILMMLDAAKGEKQKELLEKELESVGIRLNSRKPNIYFKVKKGGGISFNSTCKLTHLNEKLVYMILHDYKIHNAEVLVREDCTVDELIDVILGNRKYIKCLYCYNKIDQISLEEVDRLARQPNSVVCSCEMDLNMDYLVEKIWTTLDLLRVYTKRRGEYPDFEGGLILRNNSTIEHVCHHIHRTLVDDFKYALVWGTSAKHQPQRVGLNHVVETEGIINIKIFVYITIIYLHLLVLI
ncbi:P-loop containing nucleoside triphosphate hydrolase protein [Neocallimastix lanati (nom. inval.)]|nr:P-loop containing nucleoside triphosphate hydrolase protein [Neocallimastix sp. JGI-2020a]